MYQWIKYDTLELCHFSVICEWFLLKSLSLLIVDGNLLDALHSEMVTVVGIIIEIWSGNKIESMGMFWCELVKFSWSNLQKIKK